MRPTKARKANKMHSCSACDKSILKGEHYIHITYPYIHGGSPAYTAPDDYCLPCYKKEFPNSPVDVEGKVTTGLQEELEAHHIYNELNDRFVNRDTAADNFELSVQLLDLCRKWGFEVPYDLR